MRAHTLDIHCQAVADLIQTVPETCLFLRGTIGRRALHTREKGIIEDKWEKHIIPMQNVQK